MNTQPTLDLIAALHVAAHYFDTTATSQILAELERRLPIEELIALCAALPEPPRV